MILWLTKITGLSPLVMRIITGAVGLSVIFLALRWYGNRQWYLGEEQGRIKATEIIDQAKKDEWAAKEAELAKRSEDLKAEHGGILRMLEILQAID